MAGRTGRSSMRPASSRTPRPAPERGCRGSSRTSSTRSCSAASWRMASCACAETSADTTRCWRSVASGAGSVRRAERSACRRLRRTWWITPRNDAGEIGSRSTPIGVGDDALHEFVEHRERVRGVAVSSSCNTNGPASRWLPDQPHNRLATLPPKCDLESRAVLKACIEARAALAELKQAAELIPDQTMLINTIPLLEAKDSSEIENIVTTTDRLCQYAHRDLRAAVLPHRQPGVEGHRPASGRVPLPARTGRPRRAARAALRQGKALQPSPAAASASTGRQ
jgi:hypothetical protein